jgi:hypothetical protein
MPIKKLSKSKRLLSKSKRLLSKKLSKSRTKKLSKSKVKPKYKYNNKKKYTRAKKTYSNKVLSGGFSGDPSCNIATVKEPGFSVAGLGSGTNGIAGLSIPESRAMIYNPNCSNSTSKYNAMIPG